MQFYTKVHS